MKHHEGTCPRDRFHGVGSNPIQRLANPEYRFFIGQLLRVMDFS